MKRLAILTAVILLILLLVALLWQLRSVVLMFFLALAIAAALEAPIQRLMGWGWSRVLAILTVYGGVFGGLLLLAVLITTPTVHELDPMLQDLLNQYGLWQQNLTADDATRPQLVRRLPTTEQVVAWFAQSEEGTLSEGVLRLTQDIGNLFGQAALAVVISIYWSADQLRFERLWLSLLAPDRRARARHFWRRLQADVGSYIRSEAVQTLLAGGLLLVAGWLLGVKYPWMLALLASLAWLIPLIGGAIAVLAAALIGLLSSPLIAVGSVIATMTVLALMEFGVERRLYSHDRYWGVLVVLVMLALGDALGLVGLLVAPPVAVALQFALNEVLDRPTAPAVAMTAPQAMSLDQLQDRLDAIRLQLGESDQDASHRMRNLAARLEQLLTEAQSKVIRPS